MLLFAPALAMAQSADIVVNHADSPDPGPAGGTFTYTIRLDNNGPNDAANVRVSDTLPPGSTFVSATATGGSCAAPVSGVVNCTIGNIAFTQSRTVQVKVTLPTAGVYTNTVSATSDTSDPNPGNNTNDPEDTTAISAANLAVAATAPPTVAAGQVYSYSVTASNLGPDAVPSSGTIKLSFTVPAGASITALPSNATGWSCTPASPYPKSGGTLTCTRPGPLASGAAAPVLTVLAVTNVAGTVTAAFNVASTMPDGDLSNNTTTISVSSAQASDVQITKTASPTTVVQGGNVSYTLTPRLNGGVAPGSTGSGLITVVDTLGAGLAFVSASGSGWTCAQTMAQEITCTRPGPYAAGNFTNMPVITIVATATNAGTLSNSATISILETDPVPANNTSSVNVTSSNAADLQMTKTANRGAVVAGESFTYSLVVRNLGPLAVAAGQTISVIDTLPAGITLNGTITGTGWTCTVSGPTIGCTRPGPLATGNAPTITIPVAAQAGTGSVTNTACTSLSGAGPSDPDIGNTGNNCNGASVSQTSAQADLQVVSKAASPNPVNAGQDLTYAISVRNNGPDAATNATVTDTLDNLISSGGFQSVSASQGSCSRTGTTTVNLSCNLGTLAAGATATVTVVVRPSIAATGSRTNTATINSPDVGDPTRGNNSASVTSTVNALVDLVASKSATPNPVKAGTPLTYVATVRNNGPSTAAGVTLADTLPSNAAFVSLDNVSNGSCTLVPAGQIGGTLNCSLGSLTSGSQATVTYQVRPLATAVGGNVANSAAVATTTQELVTTNNNASTSTPVTAAQLDILVNKFDSVDPVLLGQPTVYTILINNAGPSFGSNLRLTDIFPAPPPSNTSQATFSYEGGLAVDSGGTCVEPGLGVTSGTLRCSFPGLAAGQTATVRYTMKAQTLTVLGAFAGTAFNQASVAVDETETTLANNQVVHDTTARRFSENADLAISKTTTGGTAAPGGVIDYLITASNAGPALSTTAQVVDVLPAGVTLVSAPGCANASGALTCAIGTLAVGASKTFNLQVRLDPVYGGANPLVNSATLDSPGDPNPANNSSTVSTSVTGPNLYNADLTLAKTTAATTAAPGGTIAYTLTVRNNGPQASDGATVNDPLPAGTSFVAGAGCAQNLGTVSCAVGPLANGSDKVFNIDLRLDSVYPGANPLVNGASVAAPGDPDTTNNSASVGTPVAGPNLYDADLALTLTTTATTAAPGGTISYVLTVTNNGPQASDGATLSFALPPGTTLVPSAGCTLTGNIVSCAIGPLANGANKVFNVQLKLDTVYGGSTPLTVAATVNAPGDPVLPNNSASVGTPVAGPNLYDADLALTLTTTATTAAPGATIPYVVTVSNNGPQTSDGASVTFTLPVGTTLVPSAGCTLTGSIVSCAIGPLANGANKVFNVQLKLDTVYGGSTPLTVAGAVNAPGDPVLPNNSASVDTPVAGPNLYDADLALAISTTATTAAPGGTISYVLTVTNNGLQGSDGATLTFALPPGTALVPGAGCTLTGTTVSCAIGPLANGANKVFSVQLKLDDVYAGATPLILAGTVNAPGDPILPNNSASVGTPVAGPNLYDADLALTLTTTATTAAPGGAIPYVLTVTNNGPQASDGATVSFALPPGTTLVPNADCALTGSIVSCAIGPLASGANKVFNVQLKLDTVYGGPTPLVLDATANASGDPNTTNNSASASTPVSGPNLYDADLALTLATTAITAAPGGTIPYVFTVTNNGPQASDGATVTFALPPGTTLVPSAGCTLIGNIVSCAIGLLGNGANKVFNVQLKLDGAYTGATPLTVAGTVNAPGDPILPNNSASISTPVAGSNLYDADLALAISSTTATAAPGAKVPYVLTVTNNGPQASDGATVSFTPPVGATFVPGAGCTLSGNIVSCAVGPLANGANKAFSVQLKLDDGYTGATPLILAATVNAPGDPVLPNNSASISTPVAGPSPGSADLSVAITTTATLATPGATIDYRVDVRNLGPAASGGSTVKIVLPPGTSLVSAPGCSEAGGVVNCAVGGLAVGAGTNFSLQLRLADSYGGARPLVTGATLDAPGDPVLSNNTASASTPVLEPVAGAVGIPTLSQWAAALLAALIALTAVAARRRDRRAR